MNSEQKSEVSAEPPGGLDARFCALMNASPVMIWVSGEDKRAIWFNKAWLDFTGRTMAQDVGDGWTAGMHPDDRERCRHIYTSHFDEQVNFRLRYRYRRRDGAYRWIDDIAMTRFSRDGRFLGYVGACTDINDPVEAEIEFNRLRAALEQQIGDRTIQLEDESAAHHETERNFLNSAAQLELLIHGIKDYAIYMLDRRGYVSSWNSGAERIKGYSAAEILGRHFSSFYTEEDRATDLPARALHIAATEGKFEAEGWRVRKDGSRFWASVLIDPIHDKAGKLVGFGKVTRDMTEKRLAQEELERARESILQMQKMEAVGQLTGGVAHDFNNLLMVIMGNLEIAQRHAALDSGGESRLHRALASAMQGASRAATLTQRMLAFSRRQPLDPKVLDLNRFIAGEVEFLQRTLGEEIEVESVGGAGLWKVEVDGNQLEAALLNLAVNARDAMPAGGKLTIETCNAYLDSDYSRANSDVKPGQYVLLSVTDSGEGMSRDVSDRAFEPFFSTKAAGHGTGLGLSQVYGFIKQSGGHVKIYSEPGEGTTIRIYLPRSRAAVGVAAPESGAVSAPVTAGETVLLVEDDEDVRAYLIETLRELGYRVLPAPEAKAALAILEDGGQRIDLLLTDVVLPGMNGRELSRKAQGVRPGLKVLFMTGYSRNAIVHQGRLDPDVELMQKPVTQEQLANRIRAILSGATRQ